MPRIPALRPGLRVLAPIAPRPGRTRHASAWIPQRGDGLAASRDMGFGLQPSLLATAAWPPPNPAGLLRTPRLAPDCRYNRRAHIEPERALVVGARRGGRPRPQTCVESGPRASVLPYEGVTGHPACRKGCEPPIELACRACAEMPKEEPAAAEGNVIFAKQARDGGRPAGGARQAPACHPPQDMEGAWPPCSSLSWAATAEQRRPRLGLRCVFSYMGCRGSGAPRSWLAATTEPADVGEHRSACRRLRSRAGAAAIGGARRGQRIRTTRRGFRAPGGGPMAVQRPMRAAVSAYASVDPRVLGPVH
jgi:hypothetical protein